MGMYWLWIKSVGRHWFGYLGGGAFVVLLGLWERYKRDNVPSPIYWAVAIVGILYSFFQSWKDEHERWLGESRRNVKPELVASIRSYRLQAGVERSQTQVQLSMDIANHRNVETSVSEIEFRIATSDGQAVTDTKRTRQPFLVAHAVHKALNCTFCVHAKVGDLVPDNAELILLDGLGNRHRTRIVTPCELLPAKAPRPAVVRSPWIARYTDWLG